MYADNIVSTQENLLEYKAKLVFSVKHGKSVRHSTHRISPKDQLLLTKDSVLATNQLDTEDYDQQMNDQENKSRSFQHPPWTQVLIKNRRKPL